MSDLKSDLVELRARILAALEAASDEAALEAVRVSALGKKGVISELLKTLGGMSPEERKHNGPLINALKDDVGPARAARREVLRARALDARLNTETVDVTLPVREGVAEAGRVHPLTQTYDEVTAIFADMG